MNLDNIDVQIRMNGRLFYPPDWMRSKMEDTAKECLLELNRQRGDLQKDILFKKIRRLLPDTPIPQKLVGAAKCDSLFVKFSQFADICHKTKEGSFFWEPKEENLNHFLFQELTELHHELSKEIRNVLDEKCRLPATIEKKIQFPGDVLEQIAAIAEDPETEEQEKAIICRYLDTHGLIDDIDDLLKQMIAQARIPCNVGLTLDLGKQLAPGLLENIEIRWIDSPEKLEALSDVIFSCRAIFEMRKRGDTTSQDYENRVQKLTNAYLVNAKRQFAAKEEIYLSLHDFAKAALNAAKEPVPELRMKAVTLIEAAQKIVPISSEETRKQLLTAIQSRNHCELFEKILHLCSRIKQLKEKGDRDSEELKDLVTRLKKVLQGPMYVLFQKDKVTLNYLQDMIIAAEETKAKGWLW